MASFSLVLGILGNAISILVFSAPLPTFWRIFKRKSTENFRATPYICTLLSTSLWSYYGIIKPGGTLILTINVAGSAFQSFYLILFLIFAPKATKAQTGLLAFFLDGVCFFIILLVTLMVTQGEKRILVVGIICAVISVSMYAAPLGIMRTVIRTKSVEFMPFFLSLFLFLNGGIWSTYALLVKDVFVEIPNAIGFILGGVQLALYFFYRTSKPKKSDGKVESSVGWKPSQDLEIGRTASLPKRLDLSKQSGMPRQQSLPIKLLKVSSAKIADFVKSLQDNEPSAVKINDNGDDTHLTSAE